MPPKERNRLSEQEAAILRQWIKSGAPWPVQTTVTRTAGDATNKWQLKAEDIWAFQPVQKPTVPASSALNPIDAFINAKLKAAGVEPAPPAPKRMLLRRATFDLLGLPPEMQQVKEFENDSSPDAYTRLIDRLLASPRYGEQWARHWLDVVRYADSDGFSNDFERPNAWRYRDYVIRSFNENKPLRSVFDRTSRRGRVSHQQIPRGSSPPGCCAWGRGEQTAMSVAAVTRQQFLYDVTHIVSVTFSGLTAGCARCHDHKFDPLPTREYYRLQAVYATTQFKSETVPFLKKEKNTADFATEAADVKSALKSLRSRLGVLTKKHEAAASEFAKAKGYTNLAQVPLAERPSKEYGLTPAESSVEKTLRKRSEYCQRELQRYEPLAFSVAVDKSVETPEVRVLAWGFNRSAGRKGEARDLHRGSVSRPGKLQRTEGSIHS